MERGGYIYIMTNKNKTTLYIGVTSDLLFRIVKHREHLYPKSFTAKYNLHHCIYYEGFFSIEEAIDREEELKKWRREKKILLINKVNPNWMINGKLLNSGRPSLPLPDRFQVIYHHKSDGRENANYC